MGHHNSGGGVMMNETLMGSYQLNTLQGKVVIFEVFMVGFCVLTTALFPIFPLTFTAPSKRQLSDLHMAGAKNRTTAH